MKNLLVGLLALGSVLATAHPLDSDKATAIDLDSYFLVVKDINIPSFNKVLYKDGKVYRYYSQIKNGPFCHLSATNSRGIDFNKDVRIQEKSELSVRVVKSYRGRFIQIQTETASRNFVFFNCYKGMRNGYGMGVPTIGQIKKSLSGIVLLNLAEPTDI